MAGTARKVLIAMDGSKHSDYAFDWFTRYFHRETDNVLLVYCAEHVAKLANEEEGEIAEMVTKLNKKLTDAKVKGTVTRLSGNKPGEMIVKACSDTKADIIITGTRGLSTIRRTLMGSVSQYVVHHAPVPVLVVRQ